MLGLNQREPELEGTGIKPNQSRPKPSRTEPWDSCNLYYANICSFTLSRAKHKKASIKAKNGSHKTINTKGCGGGVLTTWLAFETLARFRNHGTPWRL